MLHRYIEKFHNTLDSTAQEFLPPQYKLKLLHTSILPARITGYVSTQFGVAIEYEKAPEISIHIIKGSERVEDLFFKVPKLLYRYPPLVTAAGKNTIFNKARFSGSFPLLLNSEEASVLYIETYFEIKTWNRKIQFAEFFGNRNAENWSTEKAISCAKDEVLVALLELKRAEARNLAFSDYLTKFKEKRVLVLGDYKDEGLERLDNIAKSLEKKGYEPILVKDIPGNPYHNLKQKVLTIGLHSRFVVIDDSSTSGHLVEYEACRNNELVMILLHADGQRGTYMTAGASCTSNIIFDISYNPSCPLQAIEEATSWAEAKLKELKINYNQLYPWRA